MQINRYIIMKRQSVIIAIERYKEPICRGNFKKLCDEFNLPYHSLKTMSMPINYKDFTIYRVPFL